MTPDDPRLTAALDAATRHIQKTLAAVAARVSDSLGVLSQSSTRIAERDLMNATQFELRRHAGALQRVFDHELAERVMRELAPREETRRPLAAADWQNLSLVDDHEMDERMFSDRIGQQISHACESELRDLAAYMGSLLRTGRADQDRNPLRAEVIGSALYRSIEAVTPLPDARKLLARELGAAMAKAMPECYGQILLGLQRHGVQPVELSVRQLDGPGYQLPGINSAYQTLDSTRSHHSDLDGHTSSGGAPSTGYGQRSVRGGASGAPPASGGFERSSQGAGPSTRSGTSTRSGLSARQADAQLMALLRHLSAAASRPGEFESIAHDSRTAALAAGRASRGGALEARPPGRLDPGGDDGLHRGTAENLTGLMAVNLIRAHREELLQASGGKLDHMVIDVVGSLFDQILSDPRVPPQMARQIARLQLPVLRVALNDASFFSSRRHPVRRFVNRIASLACAFDEFDEGPGKHFLDRVRELVQEIVEGDFDQIEVYTAKLALLEGFIAEQTEADVAQQGTASTIGSKEQELRLQQRYMLQLQTSLRPMALPDWLRDFLSQVWSQALVLAVARDGAASDRAQRYRRVGRDLVMSVQPKGSPALRKKFLMQLPPLMKDLNEGLALVGWPEPAQREFFAVLLPAHAASLKAPPQSELDHNMMAKQLEAIFATPVPGTETLSSNDPVPEVDAEVLVQRFSPEEARQVGLVTESAVDWSGNVDIDLGDESTQAGAEEQTATASGDGLPTLPDALPGIDIDLGLSHADPAEPSRGPQLMDHVKLGFAYQMHMKDEWQKVRLAHVSAGRGFFVFTRGKKHQETISMTARMLTRMCETNRFRAVESSYLMERATLRARKQLAALGTATRH
jgi:hypothetical protein